MKRETKTADCHLRLTPRELSAVTERAKAEDRTIAQQIRRYIARGLNEDLNGGKIQR